MDHTFTYPPATISCLANNISIRTWQTKHKNVLPFAFSCSEYHFRQDSSENGLFVLASPIFSIKFLFDLFHDILNHPLFWCQQSLIEEEDASFEHWLFNNNGCFFSCQSPSFYSDNNFIVNVIQFPWSQFSENTFYLKWDNRNFCYTKC